MKGRKYYPSQMVCSGLFCGLWVLFLKDMLCPVLGYIRLNSYGSHGYQNFGVLVFGDHREFQDII